MSRPGGRVAAPPNARTVQRKQLDRTTMRQYPIRHKRPVQASSDAAFIAPSRYTPSRELDPEKSSATKSSGSSHQDSAKSLALGVSDFALTGTTVLARAGSKKATLQQKAAEKAINSGGDRFIPNRGSSSAIASVGSWKAGRHQSSRRGGSEALSLAANDAIDALESMNGNGNDEPGSHVRFSPNTSTYQKYLADACDINLNTRLLQYKPKPREAPKPSDLRGQHDYPLKSARASSAHVRRHVATAPERVLDAPGLIDDYFLNLLDWGSGNQVAIGLDRNVYIWSVDQGLASCILETSPGTYVSSVKWSDDGVYLGVGLGTGEVQIWDVGEGQKVRSMFGHDGRVGVMDWSRHLLTTGDRRGLVYNHDVRIAMHKVAELVSHTSEVCGLEWRADGAQLATSGNDDRVLIWDARSLAVPRFAKTIRGSSKALAWCSWNINLLATGGDSHIQFQNSASGTCVNSVDTGSQVTSLRWSPHYREIASCSGSPNNSLSIWSYPALVRTVETPIHGSPVLHSCLSPDGQTLATAAADGDLKFWKIFEGRPRSSAGGDAFLGRMTIR